MFHIVAALQSCPQHKSGHARVGHPPDQTTLFRLWSGKDCQMQIWGTCLCMGGIHSRHLCWRRQVWTIFGSVPISKTMTEVLRNLTWSQTKRDLYISFSSINCLRSSWPRPVLLRFQRLQKDSWDVRFRYAQMVIQSCIACCGRDIYGWSIHTRLTAASILGLVQPSPPISL